MEYKFESGFNIRKFVVILSFFLLLAYGFFNARNIIFGPTIEILHPPTSELETSEKTLTIKGQVDNMISLSLNERPISVDTDGIFEEKLLLSPGFNTITVKARSRFGKESEKVIKVYYKEELVNQI